MLTLAELINLKKEIKVAVKWHNAHANFAKVQELKAARKKIKQKIRIIKEAQQNA